MKKIFLLLLNLLAMLYSHDNFAQTDAINLKKYWYYHYRLVNDFLIKGDCQGCSEPMNQRSFKDQTSTSLIPSTKAKWGDQTIALGEYISVLATEFQLLKNNNQPTDTTVQELYYALRAFNRLDESAERIYAQHKSIPWTPSAADLNGFFIRDDVTDTFLSEHPNKLSQGVVSSRSVDFVDADLADIIRDHADVDTRFTMSHDQIWHIFMGLALIRRCMYSGIVYNDPSNGNPLPLNNVDGNCDIYQEALNISNRIMNFLMSPTLLEDWTIINPTNNEHTSIGWQVGELSYGIGEAACYIENLNTNITIPFAITSCAEYHDAISIPNQALWNNYATGIGYLATISYEDFKLQLLAAIGNSWRNYNLLGIPINTTEIDLATRAMLRDNQHLPLLRQLLHGGGNPISESTYQDMINSAPCDGPRCFWNSSGECSTFEWSSSDRLHESDERGGDSGQGEYPGIDYMLYYNLFYLMNGDPSNFINYMDRTITFPFPTPIGAGSLTAPVTIEAFNTIIANNIVNNNSDVTYHAGNELELQPGFEAHAGAEFHAYVQPYHCASDGDYRNANTNPSSPDNLVAYAGPTTFVNYPSTQSYESSYAKLNQTKQNIKEEDKPMITVSPNPTDGKFSISSKEKISGKISIFGIIGNLIQEFDMNSETMDIDISNYPKGIYFVKIENTNEIKTVKIVYN